MPTLNPIEPLPPRWEPTEDPNEIVIPGLDTTAPVEDQIEQIEQLITIKLQVRKPALTCDEMCLIRQFQMVDAHMSKVQHILANRVLPAVKRYTVGSEPIREAAKVCNIVVIPLLRVWHVD